MLSVETLSEGGGGSDGEEQDNSGRISKPANTSDQAKRGGIYQYVVNTDETNLDPFTTTRGAG